MAKSQKQETFSEWYGLGLYLTLGTFGAFAACVALCVYWSAKQYLHW